MIYCGNCGLGNRDGSRFCNECGQRLPGFAVPEGHTAFSFLYALCQDKTCAAARAICRWNAMTSSRAHS